MHGSRKEVMYFRTTKPIRKELEIVAREEARSLSSLIDAICRDWLATREQEKEPA